MTLNGHETCWHKALTDIPNLYSLNELIIMDPYTLDIWLSLELISYHKVSLKS